MATKWKWVDVGDTEAELIEDGTAIGDTDSILYHGADWPIKPEHKAMIAAAPETAVQRDALLAACKSVVERERCNPGYIPGLGIAADMLREAIVLAEGG